MNIAAADFIQAFAEHLRHGTTGDKRALRREARRLQIAARMLGIAHVHVRSDVHNAAVAFLRKAFVKAPVARLHVEYRNVQALRRQHRKA